MRLSKVARMGADEIAWRGRAAVRIAWDRFRTSRTPAVWNRRELADVLADNRGLDGIRGALAGGSWREAHRALAFHITFNPQRFALAPSNQSSLTPIIRTRFPNAAANAAAHAEKVLSGRYDVLGHRDVSFQRGASIDWHTDPVHGRRAPDAFWSEVPYLDPECGDHKVIWELNRHQHWLALGRAFWLTGDLRYRQRCVTELESWMRANPPLVGINWASMLELGFRSISWVWALAFFAGSSTSDESPWVVDLLLALDRQLSQIERNLSYYFSPNTHLLGEALALYVCSRAVPLFRASAQREDLGRRVLLDEARRQIATDGGHCERSTHYHRYTLDFYLLALIVSRITADRATGDFERAVLQLSYAARLLADDRGRLPLIGDDDGGMLFPIAGRHPSDVRDSLAAAAALLDRGDLQIGPPAEETYWLLAHPSLARALASDRRVADDAPDAAADRRATHARRSRALTDTGYYVSRSNRGDHLVIDGGVHGYLNGGHAHADALSLTLTVAGVPLLVDPGTGAYTIDRTLRDRLRSSHMHNTLVLDGRSQSTASGPFNWSTMAGGRARRWTTHPSFDYFEGTHDGYAPIEHRRHVLTLPGDVVIVADLLTGAGTHSASVHWHIDPRWRVNVGESSVTFSVRNAQCQLVVPRGHVERFVADHQTGLGWYAPVYGHVEPATALRATHRGALPFWMASVFGLTRDNPVVDAEFIPVVDASDAQSGALALRIVRPASIDVVMFADPIPRHARVLRRFGPFATDARVFFCREHSGALDAVIALDGSRIRTGAAAFDAPHPMGRIVLADMTNYAPSDAAATET